MAERPQEDPGTAKGWAVAYLAVVLGALAALLVLVPVGQGDRSAELQKLAEPPALVEDGHPNVGYLADAGDWFDDHFAFRQDLITLNARLRSALFGVSATDQVVEGTEGWLYYAGTMDDYQRTDVMGETMAANAAFNLSLLQGYVESRGARFALAVPPDKNALYPEWMPYWRPPGAGESSMDVFREAAEEAGVNLVDLHGALASADATLYMKTDTHWDGEGALIGYDRIMDGLGLSAASFDGPTETDEGFVGDLEAMLYPADPMPEPLTMPARALDFSFTGDGAADGSGDDVEDAYLLTEATAPELQGSLLMFRDSFGNALMPYFASTFERACFSKLEPYDLSKLEEVGASAVVVERAERHLAFFATDPPAMAAPTVPAERLLSLPVDAEATATLEATENGPYLQIDGAAHGIDPSDVERILVLVRTPDGGSRAYVAFRRSIETEGGYHDGGYRLYVPKRALGLDGASASAEGVEATVIAQTGEGSVALATMDLQEALE